ncbi:ABC transporter substrate-binding protein [Aquimarina brevivitae]|uniref:Peptide/nickel transport system substrate-binding protein n=1 Tax=Aquimarina brevivitae TaxID=323412 RepID=A0A4Q7P187_9FLAO|nr:ABC transporter substrate-binding protein [Aquimarina brevivitae]RZS93475.1 peptide/nickel transport system substrate-binding protein [Aquimarina brevivitae]
MKTFLTRHLTGYLAIFYLLIGISSCDDPKKENKEHLVFRYNEYSNIKSLDPAFARNPSIIWPTNQLFNGLVQFDETLQIKPDIAKRWEIADDGLTYTFYLRNDVLFHKHKEFNTPKNTRKVVASDFTYSFDRLLDPDLASPGNWVLKNVQNYTAVNDSTFQIQLKQPFPAFLGLLSMRYCSVVPKEIVLFYGKEFRKHPIGTGPFKFKYWEENVKLVLRKNNNYFEKDENGKGLPYLEAIAITFLPEKQSEFLQFTKGDLDLLNSLDASYKDELLTPSGKLRERYRDKINLSKGPYLNSEYLGFYLETDKDEIQSELLRKAVNYGFDRNKMITFLKNGIGTAAVNGFIPKGLPGFSNLKGYTYQPNKASQLIAQYKKETGNQDPSITITTDSNYLSLCEYIQRELEKIGLQVNIDVLPPSTIRERKWKGELAVFRASWIADYPDAENFLSPYYSKNFTPNGPNYTHFKNETFDQLYEESFGITNDSLRIQYYAKMDSIIIAHAPIVPLYYDEVVRFTQKNVKGLTTNPQNFLVLKKVWKEKQ